jgi:hypothetical protein
VQPNAVDVEEAAGGRIVTLRFLRKMTIDQGHCGQGSDRNCRSYREGRRLYVATLDWDGKTQASNSMG